MANDQTTETTTTTTTGPAPAASGDQAATATAQPTTGGQGSAQPGQPTTTPTRAVTGAQAGAQEDGLEEYRRAADNRYNQLAGQFQQQQAALAQQAAQFEALRLANADDAERAAYYQQKANQLQAEYQRRAQEQAAYTHWNNQAYALIVESGLDPKDKRLAPYMAGGATAEGVAQLATGIAKIKTAEANALRVEAEKATTRGAQAALAEAGVTSTSSNTGAGGQPDRRTPAQQAYESERARLNEKRKAGRPVTPAEFAELRKLQNAAGQ